MGPLGCILLLTVAFAPAMASAAPQGAPMTEPPPHLVVRRAGQMRQDRTARPPAMGQSTHAIMMPGPDMSRASGSRGEASPALGTQGKPHP